MPLTSHICAYISEQIFVPLCSNWKTMGIDLQQYRFRIGIFSYSKQSTSVANNNECSPFHKCSCNISKPWPFCGIKHHIYACRHCSIKSTNTRCKYYTSLWVLQLFLLNTQSTGNTSHKSQTYKVPHSTNIAFNITNMNLQSQQTLTKQHMISKPYYLLH